MTTAPSSGRRYDLDWLRIIAFSVLILYHLGMFYVTWDWHVKSVHASTWLEPAMSLSSPWRLPLLFLISGIAIRYALDKAGTQQIDFVRQRVVRLGLPIVFGVLVVVAPQSWLELVRKGEFEGGFAAFYPSYVNLGSDYSITTPTWNHLWYVVYLLVYTLILVAFAPGLRKIGQAIDKLRLTWAPAVAAILIAFVLPHIVIAYTLDPRFPNTMDLTNDWANHAHSFYVTALGFVLAKSETFWSVVKALLFPALIAALALGSLLLSIKLGSGTGAFLQLWDSSNVQALRWAYASAVIFAGLALAQRFLNRPSPSLIYMTEAIFPWYILHQTIIIMAGVALTETGLPAVAEGLILLATVIAGCFVMHHFLIRPIGVLRPLFGLKAKAKRSQAAAG